MAGRQQEELMPLWTFVELVTYIHVRHIGPLHPNINIFTKLIQSHTIVDLFPKKKYHANHVLVISWAPFLVFYNFY